MPRARLVVVAAIVAALALSGNVAAGQKNKKERQKPKPTVDLQAWAPAILFPTVVPQDHRLYVTADGGNETARAFFHVTDKTVARATSACKSKAAKECTLSIAEDLELSTAATSPVLAACLLTSPLVASGQLSADSAPAADCTTSMDAERNKKGVWEVPLKTFLPVWADESNFGLALVPKVEPGATFHLAFKTSKTKTLVPHESPKLSSEVHRGSEPDPVVQSDALPPATPVTTTTDSFGSGSAPALDLGAPVDPGPAKIPDPVPVTESAPAPVVAVEPRSAASPPAAIVLPIVGLVALVGLLLLRRAPVSSGGAATGVRVAGATGGAAGLIFLPLLLSETNIYKLGLVLIVIVAATGLHLLVNWAGELSLAHAALIGLPAFVVAKFSADMGLSPILLLPVAAAVGFVAGIIIGLPSIRARGLQVALVTLAAGVAIDRFFFTKSWMIGGSGGAHVDVPTLGPLTFPTARALYPVLAVLFVVVVLVAWAIYRSKVGRSLLWLKTQPDAAAAFGIPVARYRMLAYAIAGALAGFAGGLTTMWVQRLTPQAFPLSLSFTYLIIVALAGRGFIGGVAVAALMIEGGRLFIASGDAWISYLAPIGLILTLTQHRAGLNGLGRQLADVVLQRKERAVDWKEAPGAQPAQPTSPWSIAGVISIVVGFAAIGLAWYHAGNTSQVWIQNQELLSGGVGGLALVVLGVGLILAGRLTATRSAEASRLERLIVLLEAQAKQPETPRLESVAAGDGA